MVNEIIEGDEWAAYGMLGRIILTKHGITYPARASGDRALGVLVGVTPLKASVGKPHTRETAQVVASLRERARDVLSLNRQHASTGEPDDTESGPVRFGKGRREKAR